MKLPIVPILMVFILLFQAVMASADTHAVKQPVDDHFQVMHKAVAHSHTVADESPELDRQEAHDFSSNGKSGKALEQCTHCCQCHGSPLISIASNPISPIFLNLNTSLNWYRFNASSFVISPDLRPPIYLIV